MSRVRRPELAANWRDAMHVFRVRVDFMRVTMSVPTTLLATTNTCLTRHCWDLVGIGPHEFAAVTALRWWPIPPYGAGVIETFAANPDLLEERQASPLIVPVAGSVCEREGDLYLAAACATPELRAPMLRLAWADYRQRQLT